jgi:23S rRNA pseudouridine955/2504/2580 synthase
VLAKDTKFLKHIQRELKERRVTKQYLALVHGAWPDNIDVIDAPLLKSELDSGEGIVRVREEGKAAITRFKVRQRFEQATLVEAMPETGRTHQIRVHCQHAGHAIVGDTKYTARSPSAQLAKVKYLCLHASKIEFTAADQKQVIAVAAPTDKYLLGLLQRLK